MATYNRKDITPIPVVRVSTGFKELDWLYGETNGEWGMPFKAISLWAGESGTGKRRTAVGIANKMASKGMRVLYFQNEYELGVFSQEIKYDSFRISDSTDLEHMKYDIRVDRPYLVIVDSVNMIEEFRSGTKTDIKIIIDVFKEVCKNVGCHVILLGQLNQNGTIKGSTTLPHLVDIAMDLVKDSIDGAFWIKVGIKHRYGRTGKNFVSGWLHTDSGVKCISTNRYVDEKWKNTGVDRYIPPQKKIFSFFPKKRK